MTPPDFDALASIARPHLEPHDLGNAKVALESTIMENCNQKLVWENTHESYDCGGNHPALYGTVPDDPGVTPICPTETEVTTKWLVNKDAVECVDYDTKHLTAVSVATNDEDRRVVEDIQQRGLPTASKLYGARVPMAVK